MIKFKEFKDKIDAIIWAETPEIQSKLLKGLYKDTQQVKNLNIPVALHKDIYDHLSIMENYLRGEHNHETDKIQEREDWKLYQETIRLKELLSKKIYSNRQQNKP